MCKRVNSTLFAVLLAVVPAFAQFEGVLEMKITAAGKDSDLGGGGKMVASVAKAGARCEMNMQMGEMSMKMVVLQKTETPNLIYHINDANKTYTEINLAQMEAMEAFIGALKKVLAS